MIFRRAVWHRCREEANGARNVCELAMRGGETKRRTKRRMSIASWGTEKEINHGYQQSKVTQN
jgi:hypothetical protein